MARTVIVAPQTVPAENFLSRTRSYGPTPSGKLEISIQSPDWAAKPSLLMACWVERSSDGELTWAHAASFTARGGSLTPTLAFPWTGVACSVRITVAVSVAVDVGLSYELF